jgi:hypothetical protein
VTYTAGERTPTFTAAAGIANQLTITANTGDVTFHDDAGDIDKTAAPSCSQPDSKTVRCQDPNIDDYTAVLGDQDDHATASGNVGGFIESDDGADNVTGSDTNTDPETLEGDDGGDTLNSRNVGPNSSQFNSSFGDSVFGDNDNDNVAGGNGDDDVEGGDGTDGVSGGSGDDDVEGGLGDGDQVDAGDGSDEIYAFGNDGTNDVQQGGEGTDMLRFEARTVGPATPDAFLIDLNGGRAQKTNNSPTSDTIGGIEDVSTGGAGVLLVGGFDRSTDTVTGTAGSNQISTGALNDTVNPLGGADFVNLGDGDDTADTRDGFSDRVDCGEGRDTVQADQLDVLIGCDISVISNVRPAGADVVAPTCRLRGAKTTYSSTAFFRGFSPNVECNEGVTLSARLVAFVRRVRGRLITARVGELTLAERSVKFGFGRRKLKLKPSRTLGRRLARRFRVRLLIDARDEFGNLRTLKKTIKVKPAKKKKKRKRR